VVYPTPVSRRRALGLVVALAALASPLLLAGCGGSSSSAGKGKELMLVSYAVTKSAYDRILPKFQAEWKAKTGEELTIRTSYGGSGSQTRAILDGLDADVATLALAGDVLKLQKGGLIQPGWEKELPNDAIITHSVVALIPQPGNPKAIRDHRQPQDLRRRPLEFPGPVGLGEPDRR